MRLRKTMKRTAAAVLALSMAVSAAALPASAGFNIDMSKVDGDVEITQVDDNGSAKVTIKVGSVDKTNAFSDGKEGNDVTITGDNTKPTESLNAKKENTSEAEKSGENTSEVEKSGETEGEGKTQNSATEGNGEDDEPTSQELLAPEDEEKKDEQKKDEQKSADSQEPEQDKQTEKTSDQVIEYGQYDAEAQKEAAKPAAKPTAEQKAEEKKAAEEKTYEATNAPTTLTEKAQEAARNVVKIINNSANALKVILRDLKVDAGDTAQNAVTVQGKGDVTLELDGKNELTGGTGIKQYDINRAGAGLRAEGKGTATIEDKDGNGSLVATGGAITVSDAMKNYVVSASGSGIDGAEIAGGNVIGKGGDIINDVSKCENRFFGGGSGIITKKISGGIVEAIGGDVTGADGDVKTCAGNGLGGDGYGNAYSGPIEISGGTVKATGGNILIDRSDSYKQNPDDGAGGVYISNEVRVSEGTLIAQGGNTKDSNGGAGIGNATISGGTVVAVGGAGSKTGGDGFNKNGTVKVTGGSVTAQGGKGNNKNGAAVGNDKNVIGTVNKVESGHVHEYADSQTVKEATCTSEGYKLKKCSKCGVEELERIAIDKDAHSWVESKHKDATCTEDGYTEYKCSACGETKRDNIISATGEHHFTVVKEVVAPTYTSEGYTIYKCETCDETEKRDVVPMLVPESNGGSSAVTLTVTGAGAYETSMADGRYVVAVPAETAVLSGCLSNLKELKAQGVNTLVFRTQLRETALNIDSMLSLGVDGTLFTLTHSGESAELTVGGVAHNELLH